MNMLKNNMPSNKILIVSFIALVIVYFSLKNKTDQKVNNTDNPVLADTFIPKGYVLVPIELRNMATIKSLIGAYGLVDLYAESEQKSNSLVVSKVKIVRAPLNSELYAVLVTDSQASEIIKSPQGFWAAVQNRHNYLDTKKQSETRQKQPQRTQSVEIEYYEGDSL